jgi:hypothetical protein
MRCVVVVVACVCVGLAGGCNGRPAGQGSAGQVLKSPATAHADWSTQPKVAKSTKPTKSTVQAEPPELAQAYRRLKEEDYAGAEHLARKIRSQCPRDVNYILGVVYLNKFAGHEVSIKEFTEYIETATDDNDRGKGYKYRSAAYMAKGANAAKFRDMQTAAEGLRDSMADLRRAERLLTDQKELDEVRGMIVKTQKQVDDLLKRHGQ